MVISDHNFEQIQAPSSLGSDSAFLRDPPNPTMTNRLDTHTVVRSPQQLKLHRALDEIKWVGTISELSDSVTLTSPFALEPIPITRDGIILADFGRWRAAIIDGRREINCIEYPLSEDEALQFIIGHCQPRCGWNAFIRVRLALKLEPHFQKKALANMRAGGKCKGLANLPEAQHIDAREEIALVARVSARNVSKVKTILQTGHPNVICALQDGMITIHRAVQWCKQPKEEQAQQLIEYISEHETNQVIRQTIARLKGKAGIDPMAALSALQFHETRRPGSVVVGFTRLQCTFVLIGQALRPDLPSQGVLKLK
jgi:hypothetical protein